MPRSRSRTRAGFTLIELLAVLVILSILFAFLITTVLSGGDRVLAQNTRQFLSQIAAATSSFELDTGDYPPSTSPPEADRGNNRVNMGIEELVIALFPAGGGGADLPEDRFVNLDGDSARSSVTSFSNPDLFEISDDWGNPIVYLHNRDYETPQSYLTYDQDTGELLETLVKARINPATGDPYNRRSFQLLSAGPNGRFGTDDDIGNFED